MAFVITTIPYLKRETCFFYEMNQAKKFIKKLLVKARDYDM